MANAQSIEKKASSKTLWKSISEIEKLLEGEPLNDAAGLRGTLHMKLFQLLQTESISWYKRGFRRGHKASKGKCSKVPRKLNCKMRIYDDTYLPENGVSVSLKSSISKKN